MKQICFIFFLSLTATIVATAQNYKKFKVGFGFVSAKYTGGVYNSSGSLNVITIEPAYRLTDDLLIGLRIEGSPYGHISFTANSQYYFGKHAFRPFAGAGLGTYEIGSGFIFYPRVGFDVGHFSMSFDYNFISVANPNGDSLTSYYGIRIGFFLGGGKK